MNIRIVMLAALFIVGMSSRTIVAADSPHAERHEAEHGEKDGHADGAHAASPDPLVFDIDLAIWTLLVFLILLAILWKFAWGPICEALEHREQGIRDHIASAERANEEAKRNLADYEKKLAQAADEVRELIEEARRDADHTRQEIVADAKRGAEAERDRAVRNIETAKGIALKELAETSANLAVDLAGKIIHAQLKPEDHSELIRKAIEGFPAGNPSKN